jgi:hypothetical protein
MRFASIAENAGKNSGSGTNMFYSLDDGLVHYIFWVRPRMMFPLVTSYHRSCALIVGFRGLLGPAKGITGRNGELDASRPRQGQRQPRSRAVDYFR